MTIARGRRLQGPRKTIVPCSDHPTKGKPSGQEMSYRSPGGQRGGFRDAVLEINADVAPHGIRPMRESTRQVLAIVKAMKVLTCSFER